jgi:glycosyltransferase involved in cell wall biosynthesis
MNQSRLTQYYQACDAYVQVSSEETMGRTYMEAGGCGAPVIAATIGGVPEVVAHHSNGLLIGNPEDPAELANSITLLIENPELRAQLGAAGIRRAHEEFSWDIVAARFEKELQKAAATL